MLQQRTMELIIAMQLLARQQWRRPSMVILQKKAVSKYHTVPLALEATSGNALLCRGRGGADGSWHSLCQHCATALTADMLASCRAQITERVPAVLRADLKEAQCSAEITQSPEGRGEMECVVSVPNEYIDRIPHTPDCQSQLEQIAPNITSK